MKKANKQEMELRAGFAADLLAQGKILEHSIDLNCQEYILSRRQAQMIIDKAMFLIIKNLMSLY